MSRRSCVRRLRSPRPSLPAAGQATGVATARIAAATSTSISEKPRSARRESTRTHAADATRLPHGESLESSGKKAKEPRATAISAATRPGRMISSMLPEPAGGNACLASLFLDIGDRFGIVLDFLLDAIELRERLLRDPFRSWRAVPDRSRPAKSVVRALMRLCRASANVFARSSAVRACGQSILPIRLVLLGIVGGRSRCAPACGRSGCRGGWATRRSLVRGGGSPSASQTLVGVDLPGRLHRLAARLFLLGDVTEGLGRSGRVRSSRAPTTRPRPPSFDGHILHSPGTPQGRQEPAAAGAVVAGSSSARCAFTFSA